MAIFGSPLSRLSKAGFQIRERMAGVHEFVSREGPRGQFPFSFDLDWGGTPLVQFLNPLARDRFFTADATGVIQIGGWVEEIPCEGCLELRYFTEAKIRYRLGFTVEGQDYDYVGEKVGLRPWNLHRTHTTCYGTVRQRDTGREISRSITYFELKTLPAFLASFHLVLPEEHA